MERVERRSVSLYILIYPHPFFGNLVEKRRKGRRNSRENVKEKEEEQMLEERDIKEGKK